MVHGAALDWLKRRCDTPASNLIVIVDPAPVLFSLIDIDHGALLQQADLRVQEEVKKLPDYKTIWQTFAVLLPVKSVGVMGDQRTYEYTCAIRSVNSIDAMTADWTHLPYETLATMSNRIINEVRGINRVVYDISSKPPATIEWE